MSRLIMGRLIMGRHLFFQLTCNQNKGNIGAKCDIWVNCEEKWSKNGSTVHPLGEGGIPTVFGRFLGNRHECISKAVQARGSVFYDTTRWCNPEALVGGKGVPHPTKYHVGVPPPLPPGGTPLPPRGVYPPTA